LAAALGIGAAIGLGCGIASADTTGQSTSADSPSSTSKSSSSESSSKSTSDSSPGQTTNSAAAHDGVDTAAKVTTAKPAGTVTITSTPHRGSPSTTAGSAAASEKPDAKTSASTTASPVEEESPRATKTPQSTDTPTKDTPSAEPVAAAETDADSGPAVDESQQATVPKTSTPTPSAVTPVAHDATTAAVTAGAAGPLTGGSPATPPDSPAAWTLAAAARKETLAPTTPATATDAAVTAATPPVAVIQTPPLAWLQQIPVIGPVFVTPVVAAIHLIPIVGDIIHPLIGYPVQAGTPGAPVPRDVMITSFDGTQIYVHFMPASGLPAKGVAPTILEGPGLGMPGSTSLEVTPLDGILTDALGAVGVGTLRHAGYNVVTWDPRGEYRSGGVLELDSADYEAKDVSAIISWLATQPEAQLDSPGDPRLGMVGASYGGGIQWVTAATDHRVDAIVPSISWNTLNTSLYKSDAFKSGWGTLLTAALLLTGARPNPEIYPAAIQGDLTGVLTDAQQALLAQRGPAALLGSVTAPTLIIQGTVDTLFSLQEAQDNAAALGAGVPTKMLWFCGGHGLCTNNLFDPTDGQVVTDATLAWLARYVKGQDVSTGPKFEWVDQRGQYYSSNTYPSAAGEPIIAASGQSGVLPLVPLIGGSGPLLGVLPIGATNALNAFNVAIPAVTTTTYVVGAPQLSLTYSGTGTSRHVFAQLVDDSTGAVLGNQATPIPVTLDGQTHTIVIPMEQVAQTLRPGQSLTLQLVASTANYENLGAFGALTVSSLQVALPTITDAVALTASPASVLT